MFDWLENLFAVGQTGPAAGGAGMMAGVPSFDPSDPGAYGGRTAGDADMGGYGGSPPLPNRNQSPDWRGLMQAGNSLAALGMPSGGGGAGFRPVNSAAVRGNPQLAMQLTQILRPPRPMQLPGLLTQGQWSPNWRPQSLFDWDNG